MKDTYHHGDLSKSLILEGIKIIDKEGIASLSLRKVAAKCNVSHAAPYSHFKNKEELLEAMKDYVTEDFIRVLREAYVAKSNAREQLHAMGIAYVRFFYENPSYYTFLFAQPTMQVNLNDFSREDDYKPFEMFKQVALEVLRESNVPQQYWMSQVIKMWTQVHGLAAVAIMPAVQFSGDWEELTASILKNL